MSDEVKAVLIIIGVVLAYLLVDFVITAGIIAIICWAFHLTFSWRMALGIYCVIVILQSIFKVAVNNNK